MKNEKLKNKKSVGRPPYIEDIVRLEELYLKSKESKTLECTDFLGNIIQCTFDWNMPIEIEELEKIIFEKNLKLPKEYIDILSLLLYCIKLLH